MGTMELVLGLSDPGISQGQTPKEQIPLFLDDEGPHWWGEQGLGEWVS